jgi:hypothetical protein
MVFGPIQPNPLKAARHPERRPIGISTQRTKEKENMKRLLWVLSVVALTTVAFFTASRHFAVSSESHNGDGSVPEDVTLEAATRGMVRATAAINSNGTVASCFGCNRSSTGRVGTGEYQVIFNEPNVQAANGWSRWLQVDTLGRNFWINRSCTTADRSGHVNGVWVSCFDNQTGAPADTSFFLFVAR